MNIHYQSTACLRLEQKIKPEIMDICQAAAGNGTSASALKEQMQPYLSNDPLLGAVFLNDLYASVRACIRHAEKRDAAAK